MTFMLRQLLKVVSISLRKTIQNIIILRDYLQKNVSLRVKFSRTEKMKKSFTRIGVSIWNSIPLSVKTLNISTYWDACGNASFKMGLVLPSGTNRTLACSARAQDMSVCVECVG